MADPTKSPKATHWIKTQCDNFGVDDDGRSVAEIKNFIMGLSPETFDNAATAYGDAAKRLAQTLDVIDEVSGELAKIWKGKASVEAQKALRQLHDTIVNLSGGMDGMAKPMQTLADRVREHTDFVQNKPMAWSDNQFTFNDSVADFYNTIDKGVEWGSQDELAGKHLAAFNKDLYEAYARFPDYVQKDLPDIKDPMPPDPGDIKDLKFDNPYKGGRAMPTGYNGGDFTGGGFNGSGVDGNGVNGPGGGLHLDDPSKHDGGSGDVNVPGAPGGAGGSTSGGGTGGHGGTGGVDMPGGSDTSGGANMPGGGVTDPSRGGTTPGTHVTDPSKGVTDPTNGITMPGGSTATQFAGYHQPTVPDATTSSWSPTSYTSPTTSPHSPNGTTNPHGTSSPYGLYQPNGASSADGVSTTGRGEGSAAGNAQQLAARGSSVSGMGSGFPIVPHSGGGGGGEQESELQSQYWLNIDDENWTGGAYDGAVSDRLG
ncbi:WXG100 family type VII secretion target [Nonomuraea rhodomycinica]|uniref:WXG100 family type VII secretion target n=1 Tax=Nonomuraea rhodomycinica TaxID=1712872 RepID=A0A7Y6MBJ5_9ACTN|nr:WXG100 family type VII secretion target [Nonomuraea rhodomycinica]NUW40970.1 WXG100 family type VII secretion target [Nonomuraea rhodomycinica]